MRRLDQATSRSAGSGRVNYLALCCAVSITFGTVFLAPTMASANEDILDLDAEVELMLEPLDGVTSVCDDHVEAKGWNDPGKPFSVSVGMGLVMVPPGHPDYINERQNAYDKAVLDAKGQILEALKAKVSRQVATRLFAGELPPPVTDEGIAASVDNRDLASAFEKSLEVVHRELDKELAATAPPAPETAEEADEIVVSLGGETFQNVVNTMSREMLIGTSRAFVAETSRKGAKGEVCVVVVTSENLRNVARAMVSQDASYLPPAKPGKPLSQHIPNPKTNKGLMELLTSYGVQIVRDENGGYAVITYAQAGAKSNSQLMLKAAKEEALARAQGDLRSFMGEIALKTKASDNYADYKELADGGEIYEGGSALDVAIESSSAALDIVGARPKYWGVKHPVSKQPIAGVILVWTPAAMDKARDEINANNQPIKKATDPIKKANPTGGSSRLTGTSSGGVSGSSGASATEDDF
jgi:hypothetical protein